MLLPTNYIRFFQMEGSGDRTAGCGVPFYRQWCELSVLQAPVQVPIVI